MEGRTLLIIHELLESKQIYKFEETVDCIVIYEKNLTRVMKEQDHFYVEESSQIEEYIKVCKNITVGSLIQLCEYKLENI